MTGDAATQSDKAVKDIGSQYPTGLVLICVAGMDYAAAVESLGYDVITSSAENAAIKIRKQLAELVKKIVR
jgi:hypothetical protein